VKEKRATEAMRAMERMRAMKEKRAMKGMNDDVRFTLPARTFSEAPV
jgi:hypothetical protein